MDTYNNDETQRLVANNNNNDSIPNLLHSKPNSLPIPANRLALDAQIQAASDHQRRLRQRRRIYYIILITGVTMITFSILCFVAWILHGSAGNGKVIPVQSVQLIQSDILGDNLRSDLNSDNDHPLVLSDPSPDYHKSTLNARRKNPTRTLQIQKLIKRSEMESDEEKDGESAAAPNSNLKGKERRPTRTRKLSFAPEMVIDYKPQFRPIQK